MDGNERICRVPAIIWIPLMTCVVLLFILDVFQIRSYTYSQPRLQSEEFQDPKLLEGFLIRNEGCRIPLLKPFDKAVMEFIEKPEKPKCNDGKPPLFDADETSVFLLNSSLSAYNVENISSLACCYRSFWRKNPKPDEIDNKIVYSKNCEHIEESANISEEFIKVSCVYNNDSIYEDYFAFVPLKLSAINKKIDQKSQLPLNILMIGIDAVSRVNLHRQMPKTVKYLRNISAIELLGYNKVADNTFPNLIPVFTGMAENELRNNCWHHNNDHFDKCPFVWNILTEKGYVTSFAEDSAWMGIFNYAKRGFEKQPTDYMWGVFNREVEKRIGNKHKLNVDQCVGSRQVYKTLIDYTNKFTNVMHRAKKRYFAFFWGSSLGHDFLNMPNLGDGDYKEFFENLKQSGRLDNTIVFFLSDHGIRWGSIRKTYQGRMEERLPFLFVIVPHWFKKQYPIGYGNLLRNVRRLTTPYDLHETLMHLIEFYEPSAQIPSEKSRGYSLFKSITPKRTCSDAGISSHWCACQQSQEINKNDSVVVNASKFIVSYMNDLLKGYAQCANLTLKAISDASVMTHGKDILKGDVNFRDYMVTLQTEPGDGVFESTVRHHLVKNNNTFEVMGTISRLNLYGKQSLCITDFHLKLYCYCKSLFASLF